MKYPGMKFSDLELKANDIFVKLREKTFSEEIPKDFFTNAAHYLDEFKNYSLYKLI